MAKKDESNVILQINVVAPGLEATIKALTQAITAHGGFEVPAGTPIQVAGVEVKATPDAAAAAPAMNPPEQPQTAPAPTAPVEQAAPAPAPAPIPVPQAAPASAPVQQPTPAPAAPAAPAPQTAPAPQAVATQSAVSMDAIITAGSALVESGKMDQMVALLAKYGVQAVPQLPAEQYEAFAADLRAIGGTI